MVDGEAEYHGEVEEDDLMLVRSRRMASGPPPANPNNQAESRDSCRSRGKCREKDESERRHWFQRRLEQARPKENNTGRE
jgi:hypothetical protein